MQHNNLMSPTPQWVLVNVANGVGINRGQSVGVAIRDASLKGVLDISYIYGGSLNRWPHTCRRESVMMQTHTSSTMWIIV